MGLRNIELSRKKIVLIEVILILQGDSVRMLLFLTVIVEIMKESELENSYQLVQICIEFVLKMKLTISGKRIVSYLLSVRLITPNSNRRYQEKIPNFFLVPTITVRCY